MSIDERFDASRAASADAVASRVRPVRSAPLAAQVEHRPLVEGQRRPVAEVVEGGVARQRVVHDLGLRCCGEEHVHRARLVGLDVSEADPAQGLDRHDLGDRTGIAGRPRRQGQRTRSEQPRRHVPDQPAAGRRDARGLRHRPGKRRAARRRWTAVHSRRLQARDPLCGNRSGRRQSRHCCRRTRCPTRSGTVHRPGRSRSPSGGWSTCRTAAG